MAGILNGTKDEKIDADCIVTAVFLGLARQMVVGKKEFNITAEPGDDLGALKAIIAKANKAIATLPNEAIPPIKAKFAADWSKGSYITGKLHGIGFCSSLMSDTIQPVAHDTYYDVADLKVEGQYTGKGAYTGMLIIDEKTVYWGSTFQEAIADGKRFKGGSGKIAAKIAGMEQEDGNPVGYVHGLPQAIYASAAAGFKGSTIEVAVGDVTKKLASCFGCTTFMFATDRPPDGIHLGLAQSWAPAYPGTWGSKLMASRLLNGKKLAEREGAIDKAISFLNGKWEKKVGSWLYYGTTIKTDCIQANHKSSWQKLVDTMKAKGADTPGAANLFLDALTVHKKDALRIDDTLIA